MTAATLKGFESLPQTLPHFCLEAFRRHDKPDALNYKDNGSWQHIPGREAIDRVRDLALGFSEIGIGAEDKVAIISENRPEWSLSDLAVLSVGGVIVPVYTTQAIEQVRYILEDSDAKVFIISGKKLWEHVEKAVQSVEQIERLVFFDEDAVPEHDRRAISLAALEAKGREQHEIDENRFERKLAELDPDKLATIIYTSGTTGEPKGVMLSHRNFTSNILSISNGLPILETDRSLSVLPLSHIFERTVFYVLGCNGVAVHYCSAFDKLATYLHEVRPTIMTAVPRLFEQVYHKIVKKGRAAGGIKTKLFNWSLKVGQDYWDAVDNHRFISPALRAKHALASRLVFSKWRDGVGGELRFFVSGGAPLSKKLSYAFWAAGIPILQGYGMTEACVVCANRPDDNKVGSIGTPFEGIEMAIAEKDGEILIRGESVMSGYFNKPDETTKALDTEGWYHTGDVGYKDDDGHFYITDRIKDLFKLSNGKYVAPQQVESLLKQSPLVSQAVVVGANRKQVGALIVPDWESLRQAIKDEGIDADGSKQELCENKHVVKRVQNDAIRFTRESNDFERVKRVYLLPYEFSIDKGEMTPTLKIKRSVIDEKYSEAIDEICGS
ncbi:MAG: long-chain fatty acid--CoA ligase [Acidobacteria bacterium]|nr:MAG: long-chain fatty acid--CoA ligase [Acidobacteriota bacterium]REK04177.1 MAG: long-chain fatty acid--CoA ligase [Acidobacteriota bacterium]REK15339.1 MAG: long-chain fatty acid--CoA ligase [Acidobacteriota bacterium]REK46429.1 MAG: long-chain fatty acid--CoA ligase [Acidobacteriota bacterium]